MSLFVRGKRSGQKTKQDNNKLKRKKFSKPQEEDEVISSSEDEIVKSNVGDGELSDDEAETAQEKKLRLAKVYLQEIERKEKEKHQNEEDANNTSIAQILKEDYLLSTGKLLKSSASTYTDADIDNIKILKCKEHRSSITCLCLTDKFIFSGNKDGSIVKWSIEECKKVCSIPYKKQSVISNKITGHQKGITSIAISSDGKFLAVSDNTRDIQIWNPDTLDHIHTLKGHQNIVTGLTFRRNTHTLYSCSKDKTVKVWSLEEMAYVETLFGHQSPITSIDALTRERAITSGGMDGTIRIWKIIEESQLIYNGPTGSIDIVKLINEETFASGGDDGVLSIWGVNKKKPLCTFKDAHGLNPINGEPYWICAIATLLNTNLIATGSQDNFIKLWRLSNNFRKIDLLFTIEVVGFINCLAFTNDGKYLIAAVGSEHKLGRWNVIKSVKNSIAKIPLLQVQTSETK